MQNYLLSIKFVMKIITYLFFIFYSITLFAVDKGIVLMHGNGNHTQDNYWEPQLVDSIRESVAHQYHLLQVKCDASQFMWSSETSDCITQQILDFSQTYGIKQLKIVTHSAGGLIIRWILSNPTWNKDYLKLNELITDVIAIAPPNNGSYLAELVYDGTYLEQLIAWLLNHKTDSVKQYQIGWIDYFNNHFLEGTKNREKLNVNYEYILGSDVSIDYFSENSYCGGYSYQIGLKITQKYLGDCSDGFLSCQSQSAVGQLLFQDTKALDFNYSLSHRQSARYCFNFPDLLIKNLLRD